MAPSLPSVTEMLAALVAEPSISSVKPELDQGNRRVIDRLAEWLEGLGFSVCVSPLPGGDDKANLEATLGRGEGGLVLAGHTDTVPYDEGRWTSDPFRLEERDGRLYGLGTADMKGFFPLVLEALREVRAKDLKAPVTVLATADEETTMAGAKALSRADLGGACHALIGEPTGMAPVRLHKGILMEAVRLTGRSGHSSDPEAGVNALDGMYRVMGELMGWRAELAERHRDPRFRVPFPTLNLGHIHGGDSPNRICGACELHIDLRPVPGLALHELRAELARRVARAVAGSGLEAEVVPLFDGVAPMETRADAEVVRVAEALTGQEAGAVTFGTEGPFLTRLGLETVILGPGNLAQAHQPDEYLDTSRIVPMVALIRGMVGRLCGH